MLFWYCCTQYFLTIGTRVPNIIVVKKTTYELKFCRQYAIPYCAQYIIVLASLKILLSILCKSKFIINVNPTIEVVNSGNEKYILESA